MKDIEILNDISYGMYLVTTSYDDKRIGCIINTLSQVTSSSMIVSINLNVDNYTNLAIKNTKKFAVSILSSDVSQDLIGVFGYSSSKDNDKFKDINFILEDDIPVVTKGMCGYLICEVLNIVNCDTHDIVIAKVIKMKKLDLNKPMTYKYYREVLKGVSSLKAPTYQEENSNNSKSKKYKCKICGYVYDEEKEKVKFEDLPDDYKCPICGAKKSDFYEI